MKKPNWLNKRVNLTACRKVKELLRSCNLHTVCEESLCPNITECFSKNVATFMILGNICTRQCSFCGVEKGVPKIVQEEEPYYIQQAVKILGLRYVVITSPTRDDLPDQGASQFVRTVDAIKELDQSILVELLIPDLSGEEELIRLVALSCADVVAHNLETVPSLYQTVRKGADYKRSLFVLQKLKEFNPNLYTKSSLMLGLGEEDQDLVKVWHDLRRSGCSFLTLGQYLAPTINHYPVKEYISPEKFDFLKQQALQSGFLEVKSAPYVRSSYRAEEFFHRVI